MKIPDNNIQNMNRESHNSRQRKNIKPTNNSRQVLLTLFLDSCEKWNGFELVLQGKNLIIRCTKYNFKILMQLIFGKSTMNAYILFFLIIQENQGVGPPGSFRPQGACCNPVFEDSCCKSCGLKRVCVLFNKLASICRVMHCCIFCVCVVLERSHVSLVVITLTFKQ